MSGKIELPRNSETIGKPRELAAEPIVREWHQGSSTVEEGGARDLLTRLGKVYVAPDYEFPLPPGEGYLLRYAVERVGGVGPWAPPM